MVPIILFENSISIFLEKIRKTTDIISNTDSLTVYGENIRERRQRET